MAPQFPDLGVSVLTHQTDASNNYVLLVKADYREEFVAYLKAYPGRRSYKEEWPQNAAWDKSWHFEMSHMEDVLSYLEATNARIKVYNQESVSSEDEKIGRGHAKRKARRQHYDTDDSFINDDPEESGSEASVSGEDASDFEPENEVNGVEEDEESEANSTTDATSDDDEDTIGVGRHERSGSQSLHNSPALHNILALSTLQSTQRARRLSFTPERETSNASLHPMPLYNQAGQCFGYGYCVDLRETQGARDGPVRDEVWSHTGQRVAFIDRQRVQTDPEGDIAATQKTASLPSTPAQGIETRQSARASAKKAFLELPHSPLKRLCKLPAKA